MISFIQPPQFDQKKYAELLSNCNGYYSNNATHEKMLVALLEELTEAHVATCANATLALQILQNNHYIREWLLPSFTFPATNLTHKKKTFIEPIVDGNLLGFASQLKSNYGVGQVITVPFGCETSGIAKLCKSPTIIDAAAAASPDMHIVKEWLSNGAMAVVVSLHATKIWPAGEGAFVAFKSKDMRDSFVKLCNFGIKVDEENHRVCEHQNATNGKMSEFAAIAALSSYDNFVAEWNRREFIVQQLEFICQRRHLRYIKARQSFWIAGNNNWQYNVALLKKHEVEARNYYWNTKITPNASLSEVGICIPAHDEKILQVMQKVACQL
jgi:dTDP-4-amino-4,6-dideoxygalactose transaminase